MGVLVILWGFIKTGVVFLFTPPILYVTLLVAGGLYAVHWHNAEVAAAYKNGVTVTTASYEKKLKAERDRSAEALVKQRDAQQEIIDGLATDLNAAIAKSEKVKVIIKKVKEYVTSKADAACTIPVGFVRVHDAALPPESSGMAFSGAENDDAPARIALSTVAATVADNYAECQLRGEVIRVWQDWYKRNKALWEKTIKLQQQPMPVP